MPQSANPSEAQESCSGLVPAEVVHRLMAGISRHFGGKILVPNMFSPYCRDLSVNVAPYIGAGSVDDLEISVNDVLTLPSASKSR